MENETTAMLLIDSLELEIRTEEENITEMFEEQLSKEKYGSERYQNIKKNYEKEREEIKEKYSVIYEIGHLASQIEKLEKKHTLLYNFEHDIFNVMYKENEKKEKTPTIIHKEFEKRYAKITKKERIELLKEKEKLTKKLNKLLNKEAPKISIGIDLFDGHYRTYSNNKKPFFIHKKLKTRIESGKNAFIAPQFQKHGNEDKNYTGYGNLENFIEGISFEKHQQISNERFESRLERKNLEKKYEENELYLGIDGDKSKERLKEINRLKKYNLKINNQSLNTAITLYEKIIELSKDVMYIEKIMEEYKDIIEVNNSEIYKNVELLRKEQEQRINTLMREAERAYYQSGIEEKLNIEHKLHEIQYLIEQKKYRLRTYKIKDYIDKKTEKEIKILEEEIEELETKKFNLLYDNPDLNKIEYKVDIERIKREEKEELEKMKKSIQQKEHLHHEIPTQEEKGSNDEKLKVTKEEPIKYDNYKVVDKEIRENWQDMRFKYFQEYQIKMMISKKKIPFSEFLEKRAPYLKDLIELEKERERHAINIYKEYIKYLANEENKENAMKFSEFANRKHKIENIDVPAQYEEYDQSIRRR